MPAQQTQGGVRNPVDKDLDKKDLDKKEQDVLARPGGATYAGPPTSREYAHVSQENKPFRFPRNSGRSDRRRRLRRILPPCGPAGQRARPPSGPGRERMSVISTLQVMGMFARLVGRVPLGHLWYLLARMRDEKPHRFAGQLRVNSFFPPCPTPAFDRFCQALIDRRRVPYSTYLAVTGECPFRCPHCSYAGRATGQLTSEQLLDVVRQIKEVGTCTLGLTGGEPLLRGDLEELIAAAGPEMVCIVFTTGHGLDARRAGRLASAGVSSVTVGIESADPDVHDAVRECPGSFAEAVSAVRVCRAANIYTAVSTVGTRERITNGDLERMYELARQWGVGEFRIRTPVAPGARSRREVAMLTPDERRALGDFHVEHNHRPDGPAVVSLARLESDALFGCGAGFHHLFIDATGQVCPCDLTPLSFGDVTTEPLADIWQRMGEFFPLPRRGCLMAGLAGRLGQEGAPLPVSRDRSERICPPCRSDQPLPESYRRLFKPSTPVRSPGE